MMALKSGRAAPRGETMLVAGVMSGTSADGVDVALCRIGQDQNGMPKVQVLGARAFPYAKEVREAVLRAMAAEAVSVAELSRLNWRLGAVFADAVSETCAGLELQPELIGCHGQTIYHQGEAGIFLGHATRATWQTGEAAVLAERLRCPVISDFRPADLAAGGQAAPLVPMLDWTMFRSASTGRVLANIGGIGNITALSAGASLADVLAFDTGPGNMIIDHCMRRLYGREFDEDGATAQSGCVLPDEVMQALHESYFSMLPPKSCGREEFGAAFADNFITRCRAAGAQDADIVATATALTAASMATAYECFVADRMAAANAVEFVVAGGGAKNRTLLAMLREKFAPRGVTVRRMEELGVAAEAKEAVAFALLAWLTWWRLPGNIMGATGASRPVILGKVSFG